MVLNTEWAQVEVIDLINDGNGLAFGIIGGKSTGVVVKTILPGGVADRDGRLQSGDHILQIGEVNLRGLGSEQVASVLRQCGVHVRMVVARAVESTSSNFQALGSHAPIVPTKFLGDPVELDRYLVENGYEGAFAPPLAVPFSPLIYGGATPELHLHAISGLVDVVKNPLPIGKVPVVPTAEKCSPAAQVVPDSPKGTIPNTLKHQENNLPETEIFTVLLEKDDLGLGITVAGYVCEKEELSGIFVKSISKGGAADHNKRIKINDRIIEVDGTSVIGFTNHQAVEKLRNTENLVKIKFERYLRGPKYERLQQAIKANELRAPSPPSPTVSSLPKVPLSLVHMSHLGIEPEDISRTSFDFDSAVLLDSSPVNEEQEIVIGGVRRSLEVRVASHESIYDKWREIFPNEVQIVIAQMHKANSGLGISLEGTVDVEDGKEVRPHHYIRNILPDGPVGVNAVLHSGDELLEVNGIQLLGLNHLEVVAILKQLPSFVCLVCARYPIPMRIIDTSQDPQAFQARNILAESFRNLIQPCEHILLKAKSEISIASSLDSETANSRSRSLELMAGLPMWAEEPTLVELYKGEHGLGFSILDYQDPLDPQETMIVIRSLVPGGVAQIDGRLIPGDRLLQVNDINLEHVSLDVAVQALKGVPRGTVSILVAKPLNGSGDALSHASQLMRKLLHQWSEDIGLLMSDTTEDDTTCIDEFQECVEEFQDYLDAVHISMEDDQSFNHSPCSSQVEDFGRNNQNHVPNHMMNNFLDKNQLTNNHFFGDSKPLTVANHLLGDHNHFLKGDGDLNQRDTSKDSFCDSLSDAECSFKSTNDNCLENSNHTANLESLGTSVLSLDNRNTAPNSSHNLEKTELPDNFEIHNKEKDEFYETCIEEKSESLIEIKDKVSTILNAQITSFKDEVTEINDIAKEKSSSKNSIIFEETHNLDVSKSNLVKNNNEKSIQNDNGQKPIIKVEIDPKKDKVQPTEWSNLTRINSRSKLRSSSSSSAKDSQDLQIVPDSINVPNSTIVVPSDKSPVSNFIVPELPNFRIKSIEPDSLINSILTVVENNSSPIDSSTFIVPDLPNFMTKTIDQEPVVKIPLTVAQNNPPSIEINKLSGISSSLPADGSVLTDQTGILLEQQSIKSYAEKDPLSIRKPELRPVGVQVNLPIVASEPCLKTKFFRCCQHICLDSRLDHMTSFDGNTSEEDEFFLIECPSDKAQEVTKSISEPNVLETCKIPNDLVAYKLKEYYNDYDSCLNELDIFSRMTQNDRDCQTLNAANQIAKEPKSKTELNDSQIFNDILLPFKSKSAPDVMDKSFVTMTYDPGPDLLENRRKSAFVGAHLELPINDMTVIYHTESDLGSMKDQQSNQLHNHWGSTHVVRVYKEPQKSLGISIVGGKVDVDPSEKKADAVLGIFIKNVVPNSSAGKTGLLKTGDRILEVSGVDLRHASHNKAVEAIKNSSNPVTFVVQSLVPWESSERVNSIVNNKSRPQDHQSSPPFSKKVFENHDDSSKKYQEYNDVDKGFRKGSVKVTFGQSTTKSDSDREESRPVTPRTPTPVERERIDSGSEDDEEDDTAELEGRTVSAKGHQIDRASAANLKRSKDEITADTETEDDFGYTTNSGLQESFDPEYLTDAGGSSQNDCTKNDDQMEGEELEASILNILGYEPKRPVSTAAPVHSAIKSCWMELLINGLSDDLKLEIIKKYCVPENLPNLRVPVLNPEVKKAINTQVLRRDERLLQKQEQLASCVSAAGKALTLVLSRKGEGSNTTDIELIAQLSDLGKLLCDYFRKESITRKDLILLNLNKDLRDVLIDSPVDQFLFGEGLEDRIKTAKNLEKSSTELKVKQKLVMKKTTAANLNLQGPPRKGARMGQPSERAPFYRKPQNQRSMYPPHSNRKAVEQGKPRQIFHPYKKTRMDRPHR